MLCPQCKTPLSMADRSNIEIDFCPSCRGVWLDRGELDKLIERAVEAAPAAVQAAPVAPPPSYGDPRQHREQYGHHGHHKPYKKKSMLSEIFDF